MDNVQSVKTQEKCVNKCESNILLRVYTLTTFRELFHYIKVKNVYLRMWAESIHMYE